VTGECLLSCEILACICVKTDDIIHRMRTAQEHMINWDSDAVTEIVPGNSAWHKRVLLLQVKTVLVNSY